MGQISNQEKEVQSMRLASTSGVPHIDLETCPVSQQALKLIPREDAERLQLVCFFVQGEEIRIGALDPTMADIKGTRGTKPKEVTSSSGGRRPTSMR